MVVFVGGGNTRDVYPFFPRLKKGWLETVMRDVVGQGLRAWAQALPSHPNHIGTAPQLHPWQGSQHVISNSLGNIQDPKNPCPNLVTHQTRYKFLRPYEI